MPYVIVTDITPTSATVVFVGSDADVLDQILGCEAEFSVALVDDQDAVLDRRIGTPQIITDLSVLEGPEPPVPEDEQCEHDGCENRGYDDWELCDDRRVCHEHVKPPRRVPQEWYF